MRVVALAVIVRHGAGRKLLAQSSHALVRVPASATMTQRIQCVRGLGFDHEQVQVVHGLTGCTRPRGQLKLDAVDGSDGATAVEHVELREGQRRAHARDVVVGRGGLEVRVGRDGHGDGARHAVLQGLLAVVQSAHWGRTHKRAERHHAHVRVGLGVALIELWATTPATVPEVHRHHHREHGDARGCAAERVLRVLERMTVLPTVRAIQVLAVHTLQDVLLHVRLRAPRQTHLLAQAVVELVAEHHLLDEQLGQVRVVVVKRNPYQQLALVRRVLQERGRDVRVHAVRPQAGPPEETLGRPHEHVVDDQKSHDQVLGRSVAPGQGADERHDGNVPRELVARAEHGEGVLAQLLEVARLDPLDARLGNRAVQHQRCQARRCRGRPRRCHDLQRVRLGYSCSNVHVVPAAVQMNGGKSPFACEQSFWMLHDGHQLVEAREQGVDVRHGVVLQVRQPDFLHGPLVVGESNLDARPQRLDPAVAP